MEPKKNPNLDLNKDRSLYRTIGFAFVFAFCVVLFSFTTFEKKKAVNKPKPKSADAETVVQTVQEKPQVVTPPPPTTIIEEVKDDEVEDIIEIPELNDPIPDPIDLDFGGGEPSDDDFGDLVFDSKDVEEEAVFKEGEEAFYDFLANNLVYPEGPKSLGIQAVIEVSFEVDRNGKVVNIKTDGKNDLELENEAKRVIKMTSGRWNPAKYKKKSVRQMCKIPISFELDEEY